MKKFLKILVICVVTVSSFVLIFALSSKSNAEDKLKTVDQSWKEVIKYQNEKTITLKRIIAKTPENMFFRDSLNNILMRSKKDIIGEANLELLKHEYLSNKYMLPMIDLFKRDTSDTYKKPLLEISTVIGKLNYKVVKYNSSAHDYNTYAFSFPVLFVSKANNLKAKKYFEINYGGGNLDPREQIRKTLEWQRKIEMEHGLSE